MTFWTQKSLSSILNRWGLFYFYQMKKKQPDNVSNTFLRSLFFQIFFLLLFLFKYFLSELSVFIVFIYFYHLKYFIRCLVLFIFYFIIIFNNYLLYKERLKINKHFFQDRKIHIRQDICHQLYSPLFLDVCKCKWLQKCSCIKHLIIYVGINLLST